MRRTYTFEQDGKQPWRLSLWLVRKGWMKPRESWIRFRRDDQETVYGWPIGAGDIVFGPSASARNVTVRQGQTLVSLNDIRVTSFYAEHNLNGSQGGTR